MIGGHAVRFYGRDRPVGDLDIVVEPSEENAQRFISALEELGIGGTDLTLKNLTQPKKKVPVPRYGVDILTSVDGVSFADLFRERETVSHEGADVPLCSKLHLLRMKLASDRSEDRQDCVALHACE